MTEAVEQYFSVKTLAEKLDISPSKIRKAMYLPPSHPDYLYSEVWGRDSRRIPLSALLKWRKVDLAEVIEFPQRRTK